MYDSSSGRWLSQDPSGLGPDSNPYRYVRNQPTTLTDPSGLEPPQTETQPVDPFKDFPKLPIPKGVPVVKIKSRTNEDTMAASIMQFLGRTVESRPSIQCNYGPDSFVSQQIWNSRHNQLMVLTREWFEKGADSFPANTPYTTGIQTVKYTVQSTDFVRDGLMLYFGQGDIHPEMLGSFLLQYEGTIDPKTNEVCFKGRIYNAWSVESLTRNPNSRKPVVSGDYPKVYMIIEIEQTRPRRMKHPLSR